MITNFTRFIGIVPAALALNALNPSTASAQDGEKAAPSTFDPLRVTKKGQFAGVYTGFATSVTERNDDANHSSIPLDIPDKKEKACPNDGDVCADIGKYAKTYVADFTDYVDAIKAAKKGSEEAIFRGTPFPIPPKEKEENKDTLFSDDLRCYLEIYQAMDELDGTADGIVHGIALTKVLAKSSPERAKLAQKCNVDYFGREDNELSREIYFATAAPLFAGLTKIAYEGPNSMVEGYVPQKILDETQGKLNQANDALGRNKKELERAKEDIGNLQTAKEAAEAKIRRYEQAFKYSAIGLGGLALGLLVFIGLKKRRSKASAVTAAPNTAPAPEPLKASQEKKPDLEKTATRAAATPPPLPTPALPDDDMTEVLAGLQELKSNKTPASGSNPPANASVTAENVIIKGANAAPVSGLDETVVKAQIVLQYRRLMSPELARAVAQGIPAAPGTKIAGSAFEREVDEIKDRVFSEYFCRSNTPDGSTYIADLWKNQSADRGYIVRRGVPQRLLMEIVTGYMAEEAARSNSPFAAGVNEEIRQEAERHAGETEFFEKGMKALMSHAGR